MTTAQWYRIMLEKEITMMEPEGLPREYIKCKAELRAEISRDRLGTFMESLKTERSRLLL